MRGGGRPAYEVSGFNSVYVAVCGGGPYTSGQKGKTCARDADILHKEPRSLHAMFPRSQPLYPSSEETGRRRSRPPLGSSKSKKSIGKTSLPVHFLSDRVRAIESPRFGVSEFSYRHRLSPEEPPENHIQSGQQVQRSEILVHSVRADKGFCLQTFC